MEYVSCAAFDVSKVASYVKERWVFRVDTGVKVLELSPVATWDRSVVVVNIIDDRDAVRQAVVVKSVNLALKVALTWNERTGDAVLIVDVVGSAIGSQKTIVNY